MVVGTAEIPGAGQVKVTCLRKGRELGPFTPLQAIRSGRMGADSAAATAYFSMANIHARRLANLLDNRWNAVLAPPSSRNWAVPYLRAVKSAHQAVELTNRFSRLGEHRSSNASTRVEDLVASLTYMPGGDEPGFGSVLIVDDILAAGKTVAAIVRILRSHGLPSEAEIAIAVPLWIPPRDSAQT